MHTNMSDGVRKNEMKIHSFTYTYIAFELNCYFMQGPGLGNENWVQNQEPKLPALLGLLEMPIRKE
jgi:hypothetical protein